ncbi:hypothetical protein JKP88DRAFT_330361 [Tribonema minus]|uniref:Leishmanolysin n=1 Tax=Tribonema minus TaxID=303371 RepID=A0A835YMK8_9STRA|nr:hypothetical protein JKP88DRAFT_330361 [Tribonema minus]
MSPAPVATGIPVAAAAAPLPTPQVPLQPTAATVAPTDAAAAAAATAAAAAAAVATAAPSQPLQSTAAPLPPGAATLPPLVAPVPASSSGGDAALAASAGGSGSSDSSSAGSGGSGDSERFNIVLVNVGEPNPKYDQFMEGAKLRWEAVIVGDVPDLPGFPTADLFGGYLQYEGDGVPDMTDVDDIIIAYQFAPIDGFGDSSGDMLGTTMITKYRDASQGSFPISAQMTFDTANVDADIDAGAFDVVVLHEMAHALGFGDWATGKFTSPCGTSCLDYASNAGADGCIASTKYAELGYMDPLLVEFGGAPGDGSYCCHWDEGQLGDELMTPGINYSGYNPLTMLTIASFEDLGYVVSSQSLCGAAVSYDAADPMDAISPLGVGWRHTRANRHLRQRREASARLKARRRLHC